MKIRVDRLVWFPKKAISRSSLKHSLTLEYLRMGAREADHVYAFEEDGGYIGVPRAYGLQLIAKHKYVPDFCTSLGHAARFPREVEHSGEWSYQKEVVDGILHIAKQRTDFIVEAATGKGKTVMALSAAQKLGRTTLVIVDQENLMDQWIEACKSRLGLRQHQIGVIQGGRCDYQGKVVTVAMVQSLVQREYEEEMYEYFGTVIFDEVHTVGAPTFSKALMMFPADVRFGVSATVKRTDVLQRLLHWSLGNIEVSLKETHDSSYLYFVEFDTVYSWYANISPKLGRILLEVSEDTARNALISDIVKWMYDEGRTGLIIGSRIEQLEAIAAMAVLQGVAREDIGIYTGNRTVWGFAKDPMPRGRPYGWEEGSEYTPVLLQTKRKKVPKATLDKIKAESRLIFATYGMFSKGVDVPRLDCGMDVTPRSAAAQTHGRILRKKEDKLVPIWVTISDVNSFRLQYSFLQRLHDYVEDSAEIYKWRMDKGVRLVDEKELRRSLKQRVASLKAQSIETNADGTYTLQALKGRSSCVTRP